MFRLLVYSVIYMKQEFSNKATRSSQLLDLNTSSNSLILFCCGSDLTNRIMKSASSALERYKRKIFKIKVSVPTFKNKQRKGNHQMYLKHVLILQNQED